MKQYRVLTGDRPTGRLHLGHYVGSLQNRLVLQSRNDVVSRMYMVADVQALTDNYDNPTKVRTNVMEVVLDNLAVGVDPTKTTFFIQSMVPEIAELTVLFMNLVTVNRLLENPTVKSEIAEKNWNTGKLTRAFDTSETLNDESADRPGVPAGFLCYPVSQAADILFGLANLIPVGADQRPMIEQTNEIATSFNRIYQTKLFPHVEILVGETGRLVGTDGNAKMSKSLGNTIYLSDDADSVAKSVRGMYTCPSKISVTDTVTDTELAGNTVFQYLDIFDTDTVLIEQMKQQYINGQIGDSIGKVRLTDVLNTLLDPIRVKRAEYEQDMSAVESIVKQGTLQARSVAAETMKHVRSAMSIDYFG